MSEFRDRLSAMKDAWGKRSQQPEGVPAGVYRMQLQDVELAESNTSGKLMVHWAHLIREGEHEGDVAHDYQQIESEFGPRFIGLRIEKLGFEVPDDPEDLEETLAAIAEAAPTYMAKLTVSKEGYTNIKVTRLLDSAGEPPRTTRPAAVQIEPVGETTADPDSLVGKPVVHDDGTECTVLEQDGEKLIIEDSEGEQYECTVHEVKVQEDPEAVDEEMEALTSFAQAQGVDVNDDDTQETLTERICNEYEWEEEKLLPEELELLKDLGAEIIAKPKAAPKKKAASKKAKKTGKKKARK